MEPGSLQTHADSKPKRGVSHIERHRVRLHRRLQSPGGRLLTFALERVGQADVSLHQLGVLVSRAGSTVDGVWP